MYFYFRCPQEMLSMMFQDMLWSCPAFVFFWFLWFQPIHSHSCALTAPLVSYERERTHLVSTGSVSCMLQGITSRGGASRRRRRRPWPTTASLKHFASLTPREANVRLKRRERRRKSRHQTDRAASRINLCAGTPLWGCRRVPPFAWGL